MGQREGLERGKPFGGKAYCIFRQSWHWNQGFKGIIAGACVPVSKLPEAAIKSQEAMKEAGHLVSLVPNAGSDNWHLYSGCVQAARSKCAEQQG